MFANLLNLTYRPLFDSDKEVSGGENEVIVEDKKTEEIKKEDSPKQDNNDAVTPPSTVEQDEKIEALNRQIEEANKKLDSLINKDSKTSEWTIDKLEDAEAKCHSGEYDMKYLPKITTMKSLLLARQVAEETTQKFERNDVWSDIKAKWDKGIVDAANTFGEDVSDTNSKLFKTAQAILLSDPGFKRYSELKEKGVEQSKIDPTLIDPNLQFKCFEIAASRLGINRLDSNPNPNPGKGGSKTALEGKTLPKNESNASILDKLEKQAVDSGDPKDWIALDKERLRQQRESRR